MTEEQKKAVDMLHLALGWIYAKADRTEPLVFIMALQLQILGSTSEYVTALVQEGKALGVIKERL